MSIFALWDRSPDSSPQELRGPLQEALADRYDIRRLVGRGALAEVYLAEDLKHRRSVAIKVLSLSLNGGPGSERFQREIAIAANLHHPHILPLFDSGQAGELLYFTMPYVEGETLRVYLQRQRMLPLPEALRIARQIASALSYAHARGIVHRDIKPANILLSDGVVQVADFGIARAISSAAEDRLTENGIVIGTPAYMSPEQADPDARVDDRSDLYSLGCVLYEMLAGTPPFTAPTAQAVLAQHALADPPSLSVIRPTVPARLEECAATALNKQPADRHAGMAEFAAEIAEIELEARARRERLMVVEGGAIDRPGPRSSRDQPGILVLPFPHLAAERGQDYICDGLTDEIITSLSAVETLRVISHTSAMQLRGTTKGPRQLGQELNVRWILEGSVQCAGTSLRVSTRLIATDTEDLVWAEAYEGDVPHLFELEKRISRAVASALALRLSQNERQRLNEHRIADTQAFEYYLRAKQEIYTFTGQALDRALDYLKKGAEITGDNVTLWAAMGYVYWQYINAGISADTIYFQQARECAAKIEEIDPTSPEARRLLGLIEIHAKGDPQVAVDHLKAALSKNPNDPDALFWLSLIYGCVGRPSSGYALAIRLLDIDPLTPLHHVVPGFLDVLDGDPQRALPWLARAHELEPANPITSIAYGQALAMAGHEDEACDVLDGIGDHIPESFFTSLGKAYSGAVRGSAQTVEAEITADVIENAKQDLQYSWTVAQCYAMLGDAKESLEWLDNAVRQGFWNYPLLAERDPMLDTLRDDARFVRLMATTKKKWMDFDT